MIAVRVTLDSDTACGFDDLKACTCPPQEVRHPGIHLLIPASGASSGYGRSASKLNDAEIQIPAGARGQARPVASVREDIIWAGRPFAI
jgi:hypothetical protein